ncbi:MAG TPA: bacillithiol biosynthesis BshC [Gemmatimonadaceae bacterium]|jgi:bacillithiol biosynthesis cysteine-adding enzyme BshC|nr:bacillithiol biosynthesis BshC [Gemmatimonadaceae bacterium]
MSRPEVRTESLGGSPLSVAARAGRLPDWYAPLPRDARGWRAHARDVVRDVPSDWLDALSPAFSARGAAAKRLSLSAHGQGIVVTTGQQPGLFGGPIMTLAKAITARAIADVLRDATGLSVAPVFWAATDDADFAETASVWVSTEAGADELRLTHAPRAGTPMALAPLDDSIRPLAERLRAASGSAAHSSYLDEAVAAYSRPNTIGGAYVEVLRELLEPLEIAVLDASHEAVIARARGILVQAAQSAESLALAVHARSEAIRAAGFHPQVEEVAGLSLVSITEDGKKRRLPIREAAAPNIPRNAHLSPTVLLRPVVERAILPTATYIGGPGEVAYFAQVSAVAETLRAAIPRIAPRWSTTIVEPRVRKCLDGLRLSPDDLADPHAAETRTARERVAPDVEAAIQLLRADLARALGALRAADSQLLSPRALEGAQRGIEHRIERLERRVLAGVKRRESALMHDIAVVRGSLYPGGIRQERRQAFVPLLAKYGPALVDEMLTAAKAHARGLVNDVTTLAAPSVETAARV